MRPECAVHTGVIRIGMILVREGDFNAMLLRAKPHRTARHGRRLFRDRRDQGGSKFGHDAILQLS